MLLFGGFEPSGSCGSEVGDTWQFSAGKLDEAVSCYIAAGTTGSWNRVPNGKGRDRRALRRALGPV